MVEANKEEGASGSPMAGMMSKMREMMQGKMGETAMDPMQMCRLMVETVSTASEMALYATPEIRTMFEEWLAAVEGEIMEFVKGQETVDVQSVSDYFGISEKGTRFFLNRLANKDKIRLEYKVGNKK